MNYKKIHDLIVSKALSESRVKHSGVYYEAHHIIPKCLNGSDDPTNIVLLTAKEHFLIHRLLTRIYPSNHKISYAYILMCNMSNKYQSRYRPSLRAYQEARELHSLNHIPTGGRKKLAIYDSVTGKYYLGIREIRRSMSQTDFNRLLDLGRFSYTEYTDDMVFSTDLIQVPRKKILDTRTNTLYGIREWRSIKGNHHAKLVKLIASGDLQYTLG